MTGNNKHILIVEDEEHLADGIKFNLKAEGYRVTTVADGPSALKILTEQHEPVDLMILDLMLPGMSGYAVCEAVRDGGLDIPILILSARTLVEDRTRGFDVGANQYLTKPFELDELLSRVKGLLLLSQRARSRAQPARGKFAFGEAVIDFDKYVVTVRNRPARLTQMEMKLLQYFCENKDRVIPRNELLKQVWSMPGHLQTRAPDQFIRRLRKLFEVDPSRPRHFLTIRDAGYQFIPEPGEQDNPGENEEPNQQTS
jgi:two-component system OmpR family response regulator